MASQPWHLLCPMFGTTSPNNSAFRFQFSCLLATEMVHGLVQSSSPVATSTTCLIQFSYCTCLSLIFLDACSLSSPVSKSHIQWQLETCEPGRRQEDIGFWGQTWSCIQSLPLLAVNLHKLFCSWCLCFLKHPKGIIFAVWDHHEASGSQET